MAVSPYFSNYEYSGEQRLIDELVVESIQMWGVDCFYLPRTLENFDKLYGEDAISSYKNNYMIDVFPISTSSGFGGPGDLMSKLNIQIRDTITLAVARTTFENEVGQHEGITRPREGDLVFFGFNKKIFEVKFVEHEPVFYQVGALQWYHLELELFEYSNEKFSTGIAEVDSLQKELTTNLVEFGIMSSSGYTVISSNGYPVVHSGYNFTNQIGEAFEDNTQVQQESDSFLDWSEHDPFSEKGTF